MVDTGYGLGGSLGDCRPALQKGQKYQMVKTPGGSLGVLQSSLAVGYSDAEYGVAELHHLVLHSNFRLA